MCVFFLSCKFGDAVSQTAQAYLPACFDFGDSNKTDHDKGGDTQDAVAEGGRTEGAAAEADEMGGLPWTRPAPPARARRLSSRLLRLSVAQSTYAAEKLGKPPPLPIGLRGGGAVGPGSAAPGRSRGVPNAFHSLLRGVRIGAAANCARAVCAA